MNIHRILQFGLRLIIPGRLWRCKEYVPQIMNLLCKFTSLFYPYLPELFFPKFIWNLFFPPMWSILHLNIETRTPDGMDIHGFSNRKWWILTLFRISKASFSLIYFFKIIWTEVFETAKNNKILLGNPWISIASCNLA